MACGVVFMDPAFVTLKGIDYWYKLSETSKMYFCLVPDIPSVMYVPQYNTKGDLIKLTLNIIEVSMFNLVLIWIKF